MANTLRNLATHTSAQGAGLRKVALACLDWRKAKNPPLSLGAASIVATLQQSAVSVHPFATNVAINSRNSVHDLVGRITQAIATSDDPTSWDIAVGAYVWNEPELQALLKGLRANLSNRIVLGGPQITYAETGSLETLYPQADVFVRGFAESALLDLATRPIGSSIQGVHYANQPDEGLKAETSLESLPSPFLSGVVQPQPFIWWETKRGCPFSCTFCQHRSPHYKSQRLKFPESRIGREIEWICSHPIIDDIAVLDPTFNAGPEHVQILRDFARLGYRGKLSLQCRIEMMTPEFIDAVVELNRTAETVLEFGLQTIHPSEQRIIKRPNNMKKVTRLLDEVIEKGIHCEVSLIFGLPGQTYQSFEESVNYCKKMRVPVIFAFPLMLLRGTELHEQKAALGLVESNEIPDAMESEMKLIPHVLESPSFTYTEWQRMADLAASLDQWNAVSPKSQHKLNRITSMLTHTTRESLRATAAA